MSMINSIKNIYYYFIINCDMESIQIDNLYFLCFQVKNKFFIPYFIFLSAHIFYLCKFKAISAQEMYK